MNAMERVMTAMSHREPDRVPFVISVTMQGARELGLGSAVRRFEELVETAIDSVPRCAGAGALRTLIRNEGLRLVPEDLIRRAA